MNPPTQTIHQKKPTEIQRYTTWESFYSLLIQLHHRHPFIVKDPAILWRLQQSVYLDLLKKEKWT